MCAAGAAPQVLLGCFPPGPPSLSCSSSNTVSATATTVKSQLAHSLPTRPPSSLPLAFPLGLRYRDIAIPIATIIDMDFWPRYNPYMTGACFYENNGIMLGTDSSETDSINDYILRHTCTHLQTHLHIGLS